MDVVVGMKVVTPQQMGGIDRLCIEEFGIPGVVLMENAALRVVEEIEKSLEILPGKYIFVFAGKGNNGGDAFAVARHLFNKGAEVKVFLLAEKSAITGDARINLNILEKSGVDVKELANSPGTAASPDLKKLSLERLSSELSLADIIVDGIFGTGLKGGVKGLAAEVIGLINKSRKPVISIDIPSGLNGESGKVEGICIKASKTVTFGLPKTGLLVHPGCEYTGELVIADIGIPARAVERFDIRTFLVDRLLVRGMLPKRVPDSNKGDYGRVLVISGSTGMTGAGCLAATAALRSGAGLVYLGVPSSLVHIYDSVVKETVALPFEDEGKGYLSKKGIDGIISAMKGKDVIAVGPGLSVNDDVAAVVISIVENAEVPLVLDADALNVLSRQPATLKSIKAGAVITPHPGEMARLAGISIGEVQDNRLEVARDFASRWGVTTVLKGARTVIATPDGRLFINPTGNAGMATGGSGDVLTGVIASLTGQGLDVTEAAVAGVYLHGLAGDRAAAQKGQHGLIAGDIAEELPYAIKEMAMDKRTVNG